MTGTTNVRQSRSRRRDEVLSPTAQTTGAETTPASAGTTGAFILNAYRESARAYDRLTNYAQSLRRWVVKRLRLQAGDTVLDIGCGTGLCFPLIMEAIGPTGHLVGIEQSAEMLACAQERIKRHDWDNVDLVCSPVETATIPVRGDAAVFCLTHDILRSETAVENVVAHLRPGASIAAVGAKWASWRDVWWAPWSVWGVNLLVMRLNQPYVRSFEGFDQPWSHLARFVPDLRVKPILAGGAYLAWGSAPA